MQRNQTRKSDSSSNIIQGTVYEYESQGLVRNISELGDPKLNAIETWDLKLTEAEHARAELVLKPIVPRPFLAISFETKNQANEWEEGT